MKIWIDKVQNIYSSLVELEVYDRMYNITERCGFKNVKEMWDQNPVIGGSVNPKDFGIVSIDLRRKIT
jgi:hypothetical protein